MDVKIFALDPGPRNSGWVSLTFSPERKCVVLHDCGVDSIIGYHDETNSIATGIWNFVHVRLCQVLKGVDFVLVEYQFPTWEKPMVYAYVKNTCVEIAFKSQFPPEKVKTI